MVWLYLGLDIKYHKSNEKDLAVGQKVLEFGGIGGGVGLDCLAEF